MVLQIPLFLSHAAKLAACRSLDTRSGSGEISGSIGITRNGEVILTAILERWTVEMEIDFTTNDDGFTAYFCKPRLVSIGKHEVILDDELQFSTANWLDAAKKCTKLIRHVCPVLSAPTIEAIPKAIKHAWLEPEHGEQIVVSIVSEHS